MSTIDKPESQNSSTSSIRSHHSGPQPSHYVTLDFTPPPVEDEFFSVSPEPTQPPFPESPSSPQSSVVKPARGKKLVRSLPPRILTSPPPRPPLPLPRHQLEREGQPELTDEGFGSDRSFGGASTEGFDEKTRTLATAICIFSTVLTMVLVLMFYLVGESAFKTILMIIGFVFCLSLLLACFLRQTTIVCAAPQASRSERIPAATPTVVMLPASALGKSCDTSGGSGIGGGSEPIFFIIPPGATSDRNNNNNSPMVQFSKPAMVKLEWQAWQAQKQQQQKTIQQKIAKKSNVRQEVDVSHRRSQGSVSEDGFVNVDLA